MKALVRRLYCNAPNLTFLIDQLVARGMAERVPTTRDRRQRAAMVTEKGTLTRAKASSTEDAPLTRVDSTR